MYCDYEVHSTSGQSVGTQTPTLPVIGNLVAFFGDDGLRGQGRGVGSGPTRLWTSETGDVSLAGVRCSQRTMSNFIGPSKKMR